MSILERNILLINLVKKGEVTEETIQFSGLTYKIRCHSIGWDFPLAEELIHLSDGLTDAIAITGLQRNIGAVKFRTSHPGYLRLLRAAVRSTIYVADDLREFFAQWTLERLLKAQPGIFRGRKVFFHAAVGSAALEKYISAGARIFSADPLVITRASVKLSGINQIELFARTAAVAGRFLAFRSVRPLSSPKQAYHNRVLTEWIRDCDVFVGFSNMMGGIADLSCLKDKTVIIDSLDHSLKAKLEAAGAAEVIELIPTLEYWDKIQTRHLSVLSAMLDLARQHEDSTLDFQNYTLGWFQKHEIKPKRKATKKSLPRKCAFIIHPLNQDMLWLGPGASMLSHAPHVVKNQLEAVAARLPIIHYGSLKGIVSAATGQEVQCDFYALPATPRQIMAMDEEFLYRRLLQGAEFAQSQGAMIVGLGAYTKVAGDAGMTVSRWAKIPITNGNSYSASTSLWAARELVEKIGLISTQKTGTRFNAKVTVVGATGSIGRVSSLLVSLVFKNVVLVANRADRLLELRDDVLALSPDCKVSITTRAEPELTDSDLVVSATSNHRGSTFDIRYVKPGAVVVDCSRPVDVGPEQARLRPDVLVIESGEVVMPGPLKLNCDLGLPKPAVYACTAETILLALEGQFESFSVGKHLQMSKVKEIYKLGEKHGVKLATIRGPLGIVTEEMIETTRQEAIKNLRVWQAPRRTTLETT